MIPFSMKDLRGKKSTLVSPKSQIDIQYPILVLYCFPHSCQKTWFLIHMDPLNLYKTHVFSEYSWSDVPEPHPILYKLVTILAKNPILP